jgi:predicted phage terminase large subunit-like protein
VEATQILDGDRDLEWKHPSVNHVSDLGEKSRWRKYLRGLRELELLEAPRSVIQEYKYKAARDCFLVFCSIMKGNDLVVAPFHEVIASAFEDLFDRRYRRLIISCPPRSGKSMLSTMFLTWLIGKDERTQHIIASYGAALSLKFHREAVIMMKGKHFCRIFPEFSGFNNDSKYDLRGGGYVLATSVGGILTGFTSGSTDIDSPGIGVALIDDPLKSSDSKAALDNLDSWWSEQMSTRRTNNYAQVVVATRFHEKDLHGILMDGDGLYDPEENPFGWRWINIQGLCEDPANDILGRRMNESHWPGNPTFSVPMLESQRKIMGSFKFSALYQGTPVAAEGQIVKNSWIQVIDEESCPPSWDVTWLAVDCAFQEKEMADETAICVASLCLKDPTKVYIREIIKGRWGFPDLIAAVKHAYKFYNAKVLCIEKAASGQSLIQVLRKEARIPVEEMKPLKSKTTRLQAVTPMMECGRVYLVEGAWMDGFVKELTAFPFVRHDDSVDAFTWALTHYALKLDAVDRGLMDSVIMNKRFMGDLVREGLNDKNLFTETSRGRGRGLQWDENSYNSPDYDSASTAGDGDPRSHFARGRRGGGRGRIGYDD